MDKAHEAHSIKSVRPGENVFPQAALGLTRGGGYPVGIAAVPKACFTIRYMKCRLLLLSFGFALVVCFGCASRHPVSLPPPVIMGKPTAFDVVLVTTSDSLPGVQGETKVLQDALVSGLRETRMFIEVTGDGTTNSTAGGLQVSAAIVRLNKVSSDARDWFGGVAGDAQAVVQIQVSDLRSGRSLERFQAFGHTGTSPGAGTTYIAIESAAASAVSQIAALCARSAQ